MRSTITTAQASGTIIGLIDPTAEKKKQNQKKKKKKREKNLKKTPLRLFGVTAIPSVRQRVQVSPDLTHTCVRQELQ